MSLHLIESRTNGRNTAQNSGGTMASVVLHGAFATAILVFATTSPAIIKAEIIDHRIALIVAKPLTPTPPMINASNSSSGAASPSSSLPPLIAPPDIPTSIPDIPLTGSAIITDFAVGPRGGVGIGLGNHPVGVAPNEVMDGLQVDKPVMLMPHARAPRYPEILRATGVQDTVVATFVVDTLGRVEAGSFEAKAGPNVLFIASVRDALVYMKFIPAEANGHRVRQKVVQAYVFSLTR